MATASLRRLLKRFLTNSETAAEDHESPPARPDPLDEASSVVVVVLDSCRYDAFVKASPKWAGTLGPLERRHSYATWTAPSHHNLLMGLLPHPSPSETFAADVYRAEFQRWGQRLGVGELPSEGLLPALWLPSLLRNHLGYRTTALVSMPVLHPSTPISRDFDSWRLMPSHNDMSSIVDALRFYEERPVFALLNIGETHYPYAPSGATPDDLPHLHGLRGTVKQLDQRLRNGQGVSESEAADFFDLTRLEALQARQVDALASLDLLFEELFDRVPPGTWSTVTADHGELFGEGGYFGHGPFQHPKVLEVPFLEGRVR